MFCKHLLFTIFLLLAIFKGVEAKIIDEIVAVVGDKAITRYEVESFNPAQLKEIASLKDENKKIPLKKKYYDEVVEFLVDQYVIEIAAKKEGIEVTDQEVEKAVESVAKQNNITAEQLEEILAKQNIPMSQYKWQLKQQLLRARIGDKILEPLMVVTEEDIKNYLDTHRDEYKLKDRYELRAIVVSNKEKFGKVMDYISKTGNFAEAAIEYSEDITAKKGGYLGWVNRDELAKNIKEKIKDQNVGDIFSVNDNNIYRIFLIESYKSAGAIDEDTRKNIVDKIREEKYSEIFDKWLERQKENIFVKYEY
ncbi:MAG: SurA N-terminal domain-containing protein [Deferribacterota bacterium]|nr:SurA N-terminal domain-containing protein [Deferribacterota bacterium]